MRMVQVSLLGFAVGGVFLGLLHYDLPYYLAAIVVLAERRCASLSRRPSAARRAPSPLRAKPSAFKSSDRECQELSSTSVHAHRASGMHLSRTFGSIRSVEFSIPLPSCRRALVSFGAERVR